MIRTILAFLFTIVVSFACGWYAAWHPEQFFGWASGVGDYWQARINHECIPPEGFTCVKNSPSPTPLTITTN